MIIPIELESDSCTVAKSQPQPNIINPIQSLYPVVTSVHPEQEIPAFGSILFPALSKYFKLKNSKQSDFRSILAREHPLQIDTFKSVGDNYELRVAVQKFKPEEIQVKITDRWITILGKHEDRFDEDNYSKQEFYRKYSLPSGVTAEDIMCELSSDGVLLISAPIPLEKQRSTNLPILTYSSEPIKSI